MRKIKICVTIMILTLSFSICYAAEINFTDVKTDDWFYKNLQELVQKNIASGYPERSFKPGNTLKFEEFIKMLVIATEDELTEQKKGQEWYQIYIDKAFESKYINEQQKSLVGQNISRGTMAEILYNVLAENEDIVAYTDSELEYLASKLADLNKADLKTLTINGIGIISGYPDGTFKPAGTLTRAEAVAVISRVINSEMRNPVSMPDTRTLDELPEVDLSHLYEIPTLLGKSVEEENIEQLSPIEGTNYRLYNPTRAVEDIKKFFKIFHNRDFRTIESNKTQYIKDANFYLSGMKEYKGIEYNGSRSGHINEELESIEWFKQKGRNQDIDSALKLIEWIKQQTYWIENFFDVW